MKEEKKPELYIPGQKIGPWVQTAAWELFKEAWRDSLEKGEPLTQVDAQQVYRACVEMACMVLRITQEERPYDKAVATEFEP